MVEFAMNACLNRVFHARGRGWRLFLASTFFALFAAGEPSDSPSPAEMEGDSAAGCVGEPYFPDTGVLRGPVFSPAGGEALPLDAPDGSVFYDHGDPSPHEQLMLELVNRARADPGAEAARLEIDLNEGLDPGTIENTPKQPLASHGALIDAARAHSDWMLATDTFSHEGEGGSSPSDRVMAAGYPSGAGENIAWGGTTGAVDPDASTRARHDGLFISPGHRVNICRDRYHEVGLGIRMGEFFAQGRNWNSLMVTQKFGSSTHTAAPYLVGVVHYDFDGDGFYDPGEGIGGIEVTVEGAVHHTATASAGGYALPVPAAGGTREVSFSGPSLDESFPVVFPAGANHKVDLVLVYEPPVLSGPSTPVVGGETDYAISVVPGATAIHVATFLSEPAPPDGADDLSRVFDETSAEYSALSTTVKHEGAAAYRFTHPAGMSDEILRYTDAFFVGEGAELRFRGRLGTATADQHARVEVSDDDGASWSTVYSQSGAGSPGETSFHERVVPLGAHSGSTVWIRFNYRFAGGSYYPWTSDGVGWYVDAVEFDGLEVIEDLDTESVTPGAAFTFVPPGEATYRFVAQPEHPGGLWPSGPAFSVTALPAEETGYTAWAAQWEAAGGVASGALADHPAADFSGDGIANVAAYALGFDPLGSSVRSHPGWADCLAVFQYTVDLAAVGVGVHPELSTDLQDWHPPGAAELGFPSVDEAVNTEGSTQARRVFFPDGPPPKVFARVRVSMP